MQGSGAWERIYAGGSQLNRYPYSDCVAFFKRRWRGDGAGDGLRGLDVGCGSGVHAAMMAREGARVTAFDASPSGIAHAGRMFPDPLIDYRVADLDSFDPGAERYDVVIDRLASTHSSIGAVERFYQRLRGVLRPGAQLFWQGYDPGNSGRSLGHHNPQAGYWEEFSGGVFEGLGATVFFTPEDLDRIFAGYEVTARRLVSDLDTQSRYCHSFWTLELVLAGKPG